MDNITIRPMEPDDYDMVHKLWLNIRGFGIRSIDDSREDIDRFLKRNPTTSVVACDGEKIVGSILCGHDGRQASFYHVCVKKSYRRQGIATRMVIYCMNAFWKQIGWTCRPDCNYYEFALNEANITRFIENETEE